MPSSDPLAPLVALGFTQLEAEAYVALLSSGPSTGYAVAKQLGRPTANTYKALQALEAKGAVEVEDDGRRHCRAVPQDELLDLLGRRFDDRRQAAARALERLSKADDDRGVYTLRTTDQVLARCRAMLAGAEAFALLDGFPATVEWLAADLEAAAARGVDVAVLAYEPVELDGVDVTVVAGRDPLQGWHGDVVHLAVDARQVVLGAVSWAEGQLYAAFTSSEPLLAGLLYDGLVAGLALSGLENATAEKATHGRLAEVRAHYRRLSLTHTPGFAALSDPASREPPAR